MTINSRHLKQFFLELYNYHAALLDRDVVGKYMNRYFPRLLLRYFHKFANDKSLNIKALNLVCEPMKYDSDIKIETKLLQLPQI